MIEYSYLESRALFYSRGVHASCEGRSSIRSSKFGHFDIFLENNCMTYLEKWEVKCKIFPDKCSDQVDAVANPWLWCLTREKSRPGHNTLVHRELRTYGCSPIQ